MKKFFIITLAAALCLALAMPAMAKVTVGGRITLDWSYLSENDERASGGILKGSTPSSNGYESMNFTVPNTLNRLNAAYSSDDGAIKGFIEFRGGAARESTVTSLIYAYIEWQVTPNNSITFGRQTTNFARFVPNQWVGTHETTILGVGFGNVNHTTQRTGIKGYWKISDMFGLVWGLYEAGVVGPSSGLITVSAAGSIGNLTNPENKLPRVDLALPIRFPWGRIEPSFTWAKAEYDQITSGDDSYTMYGLSLGADGSFGMFSFVAEVTWGQNLGGGSYRGAEGDVPVYYPDPSTGVGKIADAESFAWFIDLGFKFGPSKVDVMYGQISFKNEEGPTILPTLYDYKQTFYGISWAIGVAKGFTIRPELMFYDFDDSAQVAGSTFDEGAEWLLGLQFMLVF